MSAFTRVHLCLIRVSEPRHTLAEARVIAHEDDGGQRQPESEDVFLEAFNDFLAQARIIAQTSPGSACEVYISVWDDQFCITLPAELTELVGTNRWPVHFSVNE